MYSMTFGLRCMARGGGLLTGVSWHEDCQGKVSIIIHNGEEGMCVCDLVLTSGDFLRKNWTSFKAAHNRSGLSAVCKGCT